MATTQKKSTSHRSSNGNRNHTDVADDLKKVIAEARELLEASGEEITSSHNFTALRERLDEGIATVKTEIEKRREQLDDLGKRGRSEIEQRPYMAVGIALGVGALIGILAGRRD